MPYQYQRTPFNTAQEVQMWGVCHGFASGAKDIGYSGMRWGENVYAVEAGTVVFLEGNSGCKSPMTSPTSADPAGRSPAGCLEANEVVIRGDDGFFTEYVHVLPRMILTVGSRVQAGTLLGAVDNSAETNGPHVHLVRYFPNPDFDINNPFVSPYWQNGGTCNWTMFNVTGITPAPSNGWVEDEDSGNWYYYDNNIRQTDQWIQTGNTYYQVDNNGVYTGSHIFFDDASQTWFWFDGPGQVWRYWNGTNWVLAP
ncbi:M23 family metallopeptidase [Neobacillus dielmonensis]|uniref:M23 family metallopeptidase n=1 Tax=Neobacillus dielmonensis TaxID=1347369 RepID=UPI0005A8A912|nr:M23 family metallopeptidase [Neobacillus dielmonensis]